MLALTKTFIDLPPPPRHKTSHKVWHDDVNHKGCGLGSMRRAPMGQVPVCIGLWYVCRQIQNITNIAHRIVNEYIGWLWDHKKGIYSIGTWHIESSPHPFVPVMVRSLHWCPRMCRVPTASYKSYNLTHCPIFGWRMNLSYIIEPKCPISRRRIVL